MGKINKIELTNFRNFKKVEINFNSKCNILFGNNGCGKTNILESISILGKGRGFRNATMSNLIYKDEKNFLIEAEFEKSKNTFNIKSYSHEKEKKLKKIMSVNDDISKESRDFINSSLVFLIFLPEMERLFVTSPSQRRNFIDKMIFTENKNYNQLINKYKKNLLERNKLLQSYDYDKSWINTLEVEISKNALEIYKLRKNQINILNQNIKIINEINKYPFNIKFNMIDQFVEHDQTADIFQSLLRQNRDYDRHFGGSKIGPHKSDIASKINENIDASQLSTGQQKTLVLISLIAQCNYLVNSRKFQPILLFDEICSHLDETNREILLDLTEKFKIQFFLTGTEKSLFSFMSTKSTFYNITEL